MTNPERKNLPTPIFQVSRFPMGVKLEVAEGRKIPHSGLIQATMNASAIVLFGLRPSFSQEGGVEGTYQENPINLRNWGEDTLGVVNELWQDGDEKEGLSEVLGFYESFLRLMFEGSMAPSFQTVEAVWIRLVNTMRTLGSGTLPPKVIDIFTNDELSRRCLGGLTDEEIKQIFIEPPFS